MKNHPHDNIYSILGKLDALKPTPAEVVKEKAQAIRESVEAQGSITEGVSSVEAKLQQQFNEGFGQKVAHGIGNVVKKVAPDWVAKQQSGYNEKQKVAKQNAVDKFTNQVTKVKKSKDQVDEGCTCNEGACAMHEGTDEQFIPAEHFLEAEITRTAGKTVHRKTDFPGYPVDEPEDIDDENKGKRGRPRKHAKKEPTGLGRGRPKKAAAVGSSAPKMHDPFGRVKAGAEKKSAVKGRVHSVMESVNFKRMMDEQHMSLEEMISCMQEDMMQFKKTGICSDRLRDMMEVYSHAKKQMEETAGGIGHDSVSPQQRVAQSTPANPGVMGAVKDVAKGASNWLRGKPETGPTYEEVDPLEEELNELAKLAGLKVADEGNAFTGKLKSTPKGGKFDLDGKEYTDTSTLDEEPNEGNAFSGKLAQAKAQHKDHFELGGREIEVKEADAPVQEPTTKPVNGPKPEYKSMRQSTMGPGEGDPGEKAMHPNRPTFKNGDNALATTALESKLAAEYESIKKVSK
jgi:hypothetical protein